MAKKITKDLSLLRELHANNKTTREISQAFNVSNHWVYDRLREMGLKPNLPIRQKMSAEARKNLSVKRKRWLAENPEKHPWRSKDKFQSKPCEKAKEFLKELGVMFVEEFDPKVSGRFFSIDIALPDKMIAIEINGNQHYDKEGKLKPYYQERHDLLESLGWIVYEIHYSTCFNLNKWVNFADVLLNKEPKRVFDFGGYINTKGVDKKYFCDCGEGKARLAQRCLKCSFMNNRKVKNRPPKNELEKLIKEFPVVKLGKMFGVSDNAIRKWCKAYGIAMQPRGFFLRKSGAEGLNFLTSCPPFNVEGLEDPCGDAPH